ncbi:phosphoglyceromutase [Mesomycoplasma dispar]|uniref:2,3-bisphosphoglycerate-independent phosphoglycerate mutase n=1 Tax=Mesomycoplasma dispar TaxID=86660 RepID=A0AAJ5NMA9_9BACT|nr:2,3-bisphosphoglycerate-independent phosphoglycerate mutase [Mesomycoplasma dispar]AJR12356.1 phosphoglycerate mutase [Mesomycoplasma dispar]ATP59865.1 2,3-bisphosphoglycerate-independent phosphoglycerate mutase [Mesomycoplasma dispar]VEU62216.1 phosphoglyceromutase [Mesomycoplasma dispar]
MKKKLVLIIIDGLGLRSEKQGNGFALAKTPVFDSLFQNYPHSLITASGEEVGLPAGQMGNSEVGHLNIGAGFIVYTGISIINNALKTGAFFKNEKFIKAFEHSIKTGLPLQIMGLFSPGGVHSHQDHLFALIDFAADFGVKKLNIHLFGDGRDVGPKSIKPWIEKLILKLKNYENYKIASISGRFYSMDRDKMFDRVELGYNALLGKAENTFTNPIDYVNLQYGKGITDEFFEPAINLKVNKNDFLGDNHPVIFFNFRPDRARQLSHLILGTNLYKNKPKNPVKIDIFVSMMKYEGINSLVAFEEMKVENPLGKIIDNAGLKQLRLAETQKYAHVTFFVDGGIELELKNSDRILIDSLKVQSYADFPQMSAVEITDKLIEVGENYDFIIMNFANPDMVGHTGNLESTIKAVEILDSQIGRIHQWAKVKNFHFFITADHGNAELTEDENGNPSTKHTIFPVMLISSDKNIKLKDGKLANIAPTILDYFGIEKHQDMDHNSLIVKSE